MKRKKGKKLSHKSGGKGERERCEVKNFFTHFPSSAEMYEDEYQSRKEENVAFSGEPGARVEERKEKKEKSH